MVTTSLDARWGPPREVLTHRPLRYAPTGEWIFPTPFHAAPVLPGAPAPWLMYYSPHDAPGGICLATADRPDGPWTEFGDNPRIAADWPPHYGVSHVASPHPLWQAEEGGLLLFFHGDNGTTRWAESDDGGHFRYGGVALDTSAFDDPTVTEVSYARVFPHRLPSIPEARYVMLMMVNHRAAPPGVRRVHLAWSPDGRVWTARQEPVISPPDGWQCAVPQLTALDGVPVVLHHMDIMNGEGHLYATPVDEEVRALAEPQLLLHAEEEDGGRVGDPYLVETGSKRLLYYISGARLRGGFRYREIEAIRWRR